MVINRFQVVACQNHRDWTPAKGGVFEPWLRTKVVKCRVTASESLIKRDDGRPRLR